MNSKTDIVEKKCWRSDDNLNNISARAIYENSMNPEQCMVFKDLHSIQLTNNKLILEEIRQ
jgi:hypothetical protein